MHLHRTIGPSLGPVIGELELRGETVVSSSKVVKFAGLQEGTSAAYELIRRLVTAGWPMSLVGKEPFPRCCSASHESAALTPRSTSAPSPEGRAGCALTLGPLATCITSRAKRAKGVLRAVL